MKQVFHGTERVFDAFDFNATKSTSNETNTWGIWFTDNENEAATYGNNIISKQLSLNGLDVLNVNQIGDVITIGDIVDMNIDVFHGVVKQFDLLGKTFGGKSTSDTMADVECYLDSIGCTTKHNILDDIEFNIEIVSAPIYDVIVIHNIRNSNIMPTLDSGSIFFSTSEISDMYDSAISIYEPNKGSTNYVICTNKGLSSLI